MNNITCKDVLMIFLLRFRVMVFCMLGVTCLGVGLNAVPPYDEQLFDAVIKKDCGAARSALEQGGDVNVWMPLGVQGNLWTPLQKAASNNDIDMVKLLLKYKAEVHVKHGGMIQALSWAEIHRNTEMQQLLK